MTEITFTAGQLLAALFSAAAIVSGAIIGAFRMLRSDIRNLKDEMTANKTELKNDLKETTNTMRQDNRNAHAAITDNILRVERQQEKGLDRLYGLLSATLPRAAAEQPPTDTPRA